MVSVLIPTYNRANLLLYRALPSVLRQSYGNLEIIIACHGCTDETVERVQTLRDRRIRILEVPRRQTYPPTAENHWFAGPVAPLNAALEVASGDWLARIDDDDEWTPDHVEKLLAFAQSGDYEFVSSAHETHEGLAKPYDINGILIGGTQTWLWRSYLRFMKWNPDCWRKAWDRVNDTDLQRRMFDAGVRMGYLPQSTCRVMPRPGETTVGLEAYRRDREAKERALAFKATAH